MASVHGFNEALAAVRGMPPATVEAYSRVLRGKGVLPKTRRGGGASGPAFTTTMAGYMLAAVMRGSPTAAADNAREVGDLVLHNVDGSTFDPMVDRPRKALGWSDGITFAQAIGWLIDRHVDGTVAEFVSEAKGIEVKVDRYWTKASLRWHPSGHVFDEYVAGWLEALEIEPPRHANGELHRPMEIGFHSPLLHEMKISYGAGDTTRNRAADRKFRKLKIAREQFDVWGTESVTQRTLIAIAEVFK